VNRIRRFHPMTRLLLAALLALWLGVRLLTPAGFMPSFANGSLAIVECPEADGAPLPMAMPDMPGMAMPDAGHDHGKNGFHQLCPYAQAASLVGIDPGMAVLAILVLLAALSPVARALLAFSRRATRDRPPSQGPPLPA
jgi:hypothetical protein